MMNEKSYSVWAALGLGVGLALATGCGGATPPAASADQKSASAAPDSDGDGIPDSTDKCPDKKEDGQAPDPKDGCPKG